MAASELLYPVFTYLFHDEVPYYIETTPVIYGANQWTGFYMIGTSFMKEFTGLFEDSFFWGGQFDPPPCLPISRRTNLIPI